MHRRTRLALAAAILGGALPSATAGASALLATPFYPMLFLTITAPSGAATPTYTVDAAAPAGWICNGSSAATGTATWNVATGTATVTCTPPAPPQRDLVNTCRWNVVKVQSTGLSGSLYGQSYCDGDPGAATSTAVPGANVNAAPVNVAFTTATCRADAKPQEQLVRPWTVRCSVNH